MTRTSLLHTKKVTTKGVKGEEEVTVRTTFVDGVQTDAVQTDAKTLKEAVDEVVVKRQG